MCASNMIHQAFEEHLFVHLSVIIYCIACFAHHKKNYRAIYNKTKHLNIIMTYFWVSVVYICSLLYCYKDLWFTLQAKNVIALYGS